MRILAIYIIVVSLFIAFSNSYAEMNGAGGSWETSSPFQGGDFGAGGAGGSWDDDSDNIVGDSCYQVEGFAIANTLDAACAKLNGYTNESGFTYSNVYANGNKCKATATKGSEVFQNTGTGLFAKEIDCKKCPANTYIDENGQCIKKDYCPSGYKKVGDSCEWQCPDGMKMQGGNCVSEDKPDDCDPNVQECDEDGKPKCNLCAKLTAIINNQQTQINNQNRMTSLLQQQVTNQYQTNNLLNQLVTIMRDKGIEVDTTAIEQKLDQLIAKEVDLTSINTQLEALIEAVKESKYNDTELLALLNVILDANKQTNLKLDDATAVLVQIRDLLKPCEPDDTDCQNAQDLTEITERQDEQTGILEAIRDLLGEKEASMPTFESPQFDPKLDPFSAIRGFDINQNLIKASKQCPSGDAYSFEVFGQYYAMPMDILCDALAKLAPAFLFLAYMSGAFIIVAGRH